MGRKRKTRWRRLSIGEISANEDEDGELGVAVISLTRSHSASQNHSPARSLSAVITMTNNNKDSSSSTSLHNSSTNLSTPAGSGGNGGGGPTVNSSGSTSTKILSSSTTPGNPDKTQSPPHSSSSSSPNPHSPSNASGYHNGHNHSVPSSYNNSTHPPPNSVSSNESGCGSTSSSTGGGGGGHYNDRYHYTRENYRPPHHHHHNNHHSSYNSSASHYQGGSGEGSSSRGERGSSSYHYSSHPNGHKEYQNGYHGPGQYSGYQGGSTYYRNSHNNYRNSHYSGGEGGGGRGGGGGGSTGGVSGGEPYTGGEAEGYHYPPSSRPYGGRFRKSRTYPASSYYYANGSSKSSGGASGNTTDNINRPSYNQDEYTKITTPRQDVLFKKGYLSQKKTQPSSSSVDSTSAATTPSASTNGTPDTQSTNGINSDNSEGYENGETDYVIPYDDTIYYAAPPPPEAVFTDPNTGQVYYGHCSSTGEYYDAYPVSPVMVAAGYPPVYYPMMPYAPMDPWNGVPAPMYPMVAAHPPPPLPSIEDSSLLSPGLQGLESSPATTTNTNSDTTSSPSAPAAGAVATTSTPPATSSTVPNLTAAAGKCAIPDSILITGKEGTGGDSGIDSGSSVGDEPTFSQSNSCGAEENCGGAGGGRSSSNNEENEMTEAASPHPPCVCQKQKKGTSAASSSGEKSVVKECSPEAGKSEEDNNNEGGKKQYEIVEGVEKLHISKEKEEYSSSESVLSSASSIASGKISPSTITTAAACTLSKCGGVSVDHNCSDNPAPKTMEIDATVLACSTPNLGIPSSNSVPMKNVMVISSQHHPHMTTALSYPVVTTAGPHQQSIPMGGGQVMTTVPVPVGCPPVMIAANGMPLPPLVPATPIHPMSHPGPPGNGPGQHHPHNNHHPSHHPHHSHHLPHHIHHHPPPHHQHHQQQHPSHGPPPHHANYPHHNHHPRHHHPPHNPPPPHHQQQHHNSPHHHHHIQQQPHHHMPPPPTGQTQPPSQTVPQPPAPQPVALGSAPNVGPPPGSTPYHVYPHPTTYVYGPPVYNDEGSSSETSASVATSTKTVTAANPTGAKDLTEGGEPEQSEEVGESVTKGVEGEKKENPKTTEKSEGMGKDGESYYDDGSSAAAGVKTEERTSTSRVSSTTRVTASEAETTTPATQSCDSKLENIIASKEVSPHQASTTTGAGGGASLTLESLDKMNKEIEIRPLKHEMSGAEATEKVGIPVTPSTIQEGVVVVAQVTSSSENIRKTDGKSGREVAALASSFPSSSSSSSSPEASCPSSTNESSTSSPVNEGTSLMRSQSKLASRKNFASEDDNNRKSTGESSRDISATKGRTNSKKNKHRQNSFPNPGNNKNNKTKPEMNDSLNLLENDRQDMKQKQQMGDGEGEEKEESKKSSSDDTSQEENRQGSQNQMTGSAESGQQAQETCSHSSSSTLPFSSEETEGVHTSLLNSSESTTTQDSSGASTAAAALSSSATSSSISRKPADLTVQCPAASSNDDGQYEALQLQRSPSLANEPSSPDSLNTNQSVAGSEIAPGENLSVSESDLMNRTTSIDEVEEDLPQEVEFVSESSEQVAFAAPINSISNSLANDDPAVSKNPEEIVANITTTTAGGNSEEEKGDDVHQPATTSSASEVLNVDLNVEEREEISGKLESSEKSDPTAGGEVAVVEEAITSTAPALLASSRNSDPLPTSSVSCESAGRNIESGGGEVPSRPQSITLAVTEWLKTQGEDALTPVIPRASSSDEEGDVETTDSEDGDFNDDDDDDGRLKGRKRDDKASNLEQNQKNVYGNPWVVAPSNKSGFSTCKVTSNRRRSGSRKNALKENEGNRASGLPKSDGVCSRVAPISSSSKSSSSTSTTLETSNRKNNRMNNQMTTHMSTCLPSTTTASTTTAAANSYDQDENYLTDNTKRDKHSDVCTKVTSSISYLETTSKTAERDAGKDYDSGLELSSPENSSPSSVDSNAKTTTSTPATLTASTNANNKSKELLGPHLDCPTPSTTTTLLSPSTSFTKEKKCERPTLPKLVTNNRHNKYTAPNPDQIVIAAPLSIVPRDDSAPRTTSNMNIERRNEEYELEKCDEPSPSTPSSSVNNTAPTSPLSGIIIQSPSSLQSSSIDERDHAEICDPQKYAKYYQFGVVFDTSDDPDQGIDTAPEEDEEETDSSEDITLDSPPIRTPTTSITTDHAQEPPHQQQKNTDDFLQIMMQRTKKLAKKGRKREEKEKRDRERVLVSKSVYLQDEEEEIGTFDPKVVLASRLRRGSGGVADGEAPNSIPTFAGEDALDYVIQGTDVIAPPPASTSSAPSSSSHLYVNPLSLAAEMSGSVMAKVDLNPKKRQEGGDDNSSSCEDSSDEPSLPPYESPPSVEIPVYNATTPAGRVIRQNFYAIGDPVSGAICCSIQ